MPIRTTSKEVKKKKIELINQQGLQTFLALFIVELAFILYAFWRGEGDIYIKMAAVVIPITLAVYLIVYKMGGNVYLVIWTTLLLNMGFLIQALTFRRSCELRGVDLDASLASDMKKIIIAFILAIAATFVFRFVSDWLSMEISMAVLALIQFGIVALLHLKGVTVGSGAQAATLSLTIGGISIQPMEVYKVLFVFVLVIILCKDEYKDKTILKMPRDLVAAIYILLSAAGSLSLSEGGTMLVLLAVGVVMVLLFSDKREIVKFYVKLGSVVIIAVGGISVLLSSKIPFFEKVVSRIAGFLNPSSSYQATQAQKAIAMGGLFGPASKRYIVYVPLEHEDMIFSKLVGTTGLIIGMVAIGAVLLMFREGYVIARKSNDTYYRGLAMGFSAVLALEAVIHIAYNLSLFPITGITLYFVSHGFVSLTCGLAMVGILIVISRGTQERSLYAEEEINGRIRNLLKK